MRIRLLLPLLLVLASLVAAPKPAHAAPITGQDAAYVARQYLGYPYAWTGNEPSTGFSCIGLVHWVYARLGVYVPSYLDGAWTAFRHVSLNDLRAGDVVFFAGTAVEGSIYGLSHAAIYVGGGLMVAADNFAVGVRVDRLWDSYWQQHIAGAVRVLGS